MCGQVDFCCDADARKLRSEMMARVDPNWTTSEYSVLAYDIKHFMPNWAAMLKVPEKHEIAKLFKTMTSDAIFKM